jgi:methyl-accepting chemotaxis protein
LQGYKNLAVAREAFKKELPRAQGFAATDAGATAQLADVQTLYRELDALQDRIVALAKQDQAAAIALVKADETPLWRKIRGQLLRLIEERSAAVGQAKAELEQQSRRIFEISVLLGAAAIVVGTLVSFWLTRGIMRSLGGEPEYAAEIARSIADGDLSARIVIGDERQSSLLSAMRQMQGGLATLVSEVRTGTDAITAASGEISAGNQDLSARTEQQAGSLEETAASMEQLTSTVHQNTGNVRQASALASAASEVARKGGDAVEEVVGTMTSITESARRIVDIISVIDSIAFQTNILALNAAVEAARAGEQGRGFAVVASEVRSLAQRSATAAKEIKALIGDSVDKVDTGSRLAQAAGATMHEVVASIGRVASIMSEITVACQEQSAGIAQVNEAVSQMDQTTQQNAAMVEQAAAAASAMQSQAHLLAAAVSKFKLAEGPRAPAPGIVHMSKQLPRRRVPELAA